MNNIPAVFCWSGGKDSSYALYKVLQEDIYEVKYLLSTINGNFKRLSMHGVREELIREQADRIGIPLICVYVYEADNAEYEMQMREALVRLKKEGVETILYGDIFLEDLRQYRETKMGELGFHCVFPIWKTDTRWMIRDFIEKGFRSCICCVSDEFLDGSWCGRMIDASFLAELPHNVDPCGENGEFHSFCFDGPIFGKSINIVQGEKTYRALELKTSGNDHPIPNSGAKGFWFVDLLKSGI